MARFKDVPLPSVSLVDFDAMLADPDFRIAADQNRKAQLNRQLPTFTKHEIRTGNGGRPCCRLCLLNASWRILMPGISEVGAAFFDACETGKGWDQCSQYCTSDATFSSQAEPLADISKLSDYTEWMKGILVPIADGHYELKSFAVDHDRNSICAYAVITGTHTGEGGPVPPTGKSLEADYVYIMEFEGEKIKNMVKVWNAGWSLKQLGWA